MSKSDADKQQSWMRLESMIYARRLLGAPYNSPPSQVSNARACRVV